MPRFPVGWSRALAGLTGVTVVLFVAGSITPTSANFSRGTSAANQLATTSVSAPTGLTATRIPSIRLTWTNTASRLTGTAIYRSITGGSWTLIAQVAAPTATYTDTAAAGTFRYYAQAYYTGNGANWTSAPTATVVRDDPTFVLVGTTGFTSTKCAIGTVGSHDMRQGYTPAGAESTFTGASSTGTIVFCSDIFTAGHTVAAGTTSVSLYFSNSAGSSCTAVATLSVNGTTTLGSGTLALNPSATTLRSWSFTTTAATLAAGDRLNLTVHYNTSKSCTSTTLHYDAAATPSSVTVPDLP
jgi:hypothetical protein